MNQLVECKKNNSERQLAFRVSAKAARLMGRENVSNAEGAIVELVKNTYDADAKYCALIFDKPYPELPVRLPLEEAAWLQLHLANFDDLYEESNNEYHLRWGLDHDLFNGATAAARQALDLWIVDDGHGMSSEVIEQHWMVIGTNFKEQNVFSGSGRVRTGAKGIGRFALDRLGTRCTIYSTTLEENKQQSLEWEVNWSEFEGSGKKLDQVFARLDQSNLTARGAIHALKSYPVFERKLDAIEKKVPWTTGTAIRISGLRDQWDKDEVSHLFSSLQALVPPEEQRPLQLLLLDSRVPEKHGLVQSNVLDDFDYKLTADVKADGTMSITIWRNELVVRELDPELFKLEEMKDPKFLKEHFERGYISYDTSISEWFPRSSDTVSVEDMSKIGPFQLSLAYYKRNMPSVGDRKRYPYRAFNGGPRSQWLNEQGGIKIYRDDFVVRPYGEPGSKAYDWLRLGERVSLNPAPASRKGWRVSPQNLAGTIKISRATNPHLEDQSNREGLIENRVFRAFMTLVVRIIKEFEDDRSHIFSNLLAAFNQKNPVDTVKAEAAAVVSRLQVTSSSPPTIEDANKLVRAIQVQEEQIRELKHDQNMLRALATLGTVLVSFSHEMGQLETSLGSRSYTLRKTMERLITPQALEGVSRELNPFTLLGNLEKADQKIKQWFKFALSAVRADKRRHRRLVFKDYLNNLAGIWSGFMADRTIGFEINVQDGFDPALKALEIDLDTIFNNLLLNSVEAFVTRNFPGERRIWIDIIPAGNNIQVTYCDSGPGLDSKYKKNPRDIFSFGETTKLGSDSENVGTGIGMWILDSVVSQYRGHVEVFHPSPEWGFKMIIILPNQDADANG